MIDGKILVEKIIKYAKTFLYMEELDETYFRNLLLREFKLEEPCEDAGDLSYIEKMNRPDDLVSEIESYAIENNLTDDVHKGLYSTYIMGIISPNPSVVNTTFNKIKETEGIKKAEEYFFNLGIMNNYVQKTAIERNMKWECKDGNNILEITINLSKPEKDNKQIALLLKQPAKKNKYPACLLCKENEGFEGTLSHPARENIRTIKLNLAGEDWFVQYSPYAYFDEHCIAVNYQHIPMNICAKTVRKVFDFVDYFPNYMIGSNASLPIVGGSILNHEHFQGGIHLMPMHKANILYQLKNDKYPDLEIGILDWYNSVVRINGNNREEIIELAGELIESWKTYSDEENYIFAETDGVMHNSSSPIARKLADGRYSCDIIFRNNITNEQYPEGVFHAHPEYHNIKKEGIGLIEAMGLFVLPGRLKKQLAMIADILCGNTPYNEKELSDSENYLHVHKDMIDYLMKNNNPKNYDEALKVVTERVNEVCRNILLNTAVFKKDEKGLKGFKKIPCRLPSHWL